MSKLGKKSITIPKDTKVKVESGKLLLTGPKGSKELSINDKIFTATVADDKNLLIKLIKKLKSQGKRIIGYGASGRATVHINFCKFKT